MVNIDIRAGIRLLKHSSFVCAIFLDFLCCCFVLEGIRLFKIAGSNELEMCVGILSVMIGVIGVIFESLVVFKLLGCKSIASNLSLRIVKFLNGTISLVLGINLFGIFAKWHLSLPIALISIVLGLCSLIHITSVQRENDDLNDLAIIRNILTFGFVLFLSVCSLCCMIFGNMVLVPSDIFEMHGMGVLPYLGQIIAISCICIGTLSFFCHVYIMFYLLCVKASDVFVLCANGCLGILGAFFWRMISRDALDGVGHMKVSAIILTVINFGGGLLPLVLAWRKIPKVFILCIVVLVVFLSFL
eukprot:TRINITY_DN776198_c0_g1_i1.p1 TRINITY_DN776198_c0_g1~~TRINITY_DN776198_c0_g1_i1.p1  ORF type:complete len:301 (-),score=29.81 TRINITY_DN776198_c0_g1_i1:141-1043(-)